MKQKSRIASKLFAVLVVLTLISCCFLGTTFARYTSSSSGAASVDVANWNIVFDGEGAAGDDSTVNYGNLSSDKRSYSEAQSAGADSDKVRAHSTAVKQVAVIINSGEVNADVTFSCKDVSFTYGAIEGVDSFDAAISHWNSNYSERTNTPTAESDITKLISITFYTDDTCTDEFKKSEWEFTLEPGASKSIYAVVTWTTDDTYSAGDDGVRADDLDTFVGLYVSSASWTLSYTAVQASEQPTT